MRVRVCSVSLTRFGKADDERTQWNRSGVQPIWTNKNHQHWWRAHANKIVHSFISTQLTTLPPTKCKCHYYIHESRSDVRCANMPAMEHQPTVDSNLSIIHLAGVFCVCVVVVVDVVAVCACVCAFCFVCCAPKSKQICMDVYSISHHSSRAYSSYPVQQTQTHMCSFCIFQSLTSSSLSSSTSSAPF